MKRIPTSPSTVILRHGEEQYQDQYGARDVWVFEDRGQYFMHYDAAGSRGWLAALAISSDGVNWVKHGPVLELGMTHDLDSASASYGTTMADGDRWHMFYLGTPNATPDALKTPSFPYWTLKAVADGPAGPWTKKPSLKPISVVENTWHSHTASPGQIVRVADEWIMIFSAATIVDEGRILRTLGVARTKSLDTSWRIDPEPLLPLEEQVENSSIYYEPANGLWFLFTNHIGVAADLNVIPPQLTPEYTDAVWVYWANSPTGFNSNAKAVVIDAASSGWSPRVVGLPSVQQIGDRLGVYYDGSVSDTISHGDRDIAVTWIDLPLQPPYLS